MKFTKNRVVIVTWKDASRLSGWEEKWDEQRPAEYLITQTTIGVLVDVDKEAIIIAFNTNSVGTQNDFMVIPKKWIEKIVYISKKDVEFPCYCC